MSAVDTLRALLAEAHALLAAGEAGEAERRAKAVIALVRAERDVAELAAAQPPEEDVEAIRAEIRSRLRRLAEAGPVAPDDWPA